MYNIEEEKPFWRPTNIWRILGGMLALNGFYALIIFPSNIHPDIILYRSDVILFTVWHLVVVIGLTTAFKPTIVEILKEIKLLLIELKEVIQSWRSK
jgi:hypothetical protein